MRRRPGSRAGRNAIIVDVSFLFGEWLGFGEWIWASLALGLAFLVAALGVVGLAWWVLRGDAINRRFEGGVSEEGGRHP